MDYLDATYLSSEANREIGRGVRFDVDQSGKVFEVANEPEALPMEVTAGEQESKSLAEFAKSGLDVYAGGLKGLAQAWVGIGGDLERLATGLRDAAMAGPNESAWDAFLMGLGKDSTLLWDTNEAKAILDKYLPYQPITEAGAAKVPGEDGRYMGEGMGEFFAPGGQLKTGVQVSRAIRKGLNMLPPSMQPGPMSAGLSIEPVTGEQAAAMLAAKGVQQTAKQQAPRSDIGFYSAVEDAALNLQRNSGAGQAFLNDIKKGANVKDEEIKWLGLDDFLRGKKNVTKQEVQDYVANNRVDVQEVALGGRQPFDSKRLNELLSEYNSLKQHPIDDPSFGQEKYDELIRLMNIRDQSTEYTLYQEAEEFERMAQRAQREGDTFAAEKYFRLAEFFNTRAEKLDLEGRGMDSPPKFGQYTLPGGENYREILLTMPNKKAETLSARADELLAKGRAGTATDADRAEWASIMNRLQPETRDIEGAQRFRGMPDFKSPHWEQPNVLAHLRVNDRVDADGKKMLLVEEVQSDWHQAGRDYGYGPKTETTVEAYYETKSGQRIPIGFGKTKEEAEASIDVGWKNTVDIKYETQTRKIGEGVPDAPFKDTWYQLALKRALQYAAENGYDRVGLTTGARQAERYDLSKQIKSIAYKDNGDGTYVITASTPNNRPALAAETVDSEKLRELVGKEVADKIISGEGKEFPKNSFSEGMKELTGLDLQVGGEGMRKYYDEVYPKFLQKYGKKWDAKMGNTTIEADGAEPVRYIDITPKMKQSVSDSGQPLFTAAPIATGAGSATIAQDGETDGN